MSVFVTKVTVNTKKHGFIAHRLGAGKKDSIWHTWPSIAPTKGRVT